MINYVRTAFLLEILAAVRRKNDHACSNDGGGVRLGVIV